MTTKNKILTFPALKRKIAALKKAKKTIAFTNGCFDIVHFGHVSYLEKAKGSDRILVVGLNSDRSVRQIKGKDRPVIKEQARAALLAAFACVDFVTIFDEDTPYNLIKAVVPDILIKGADWKGKDVVGGDIVKAHGGKIELMEYIKEYSTTKIINKIYQKQI